MSFISTSSGLLRMLPSGGSGPCLLFLLVLCSAVASSALLTFAAFLNASVVWKLPAGGLFGGLLKMP